MEISSELETAPTRLTALRWSFATGAGLRGKLAVARAKLAGRLGRGANGGAEPVAIPARELGGDPLWVRPGTTDLTMATIAYRVGMHIPHASIAAERLGSIVELGSNAGASLASLGRRYPGARLLGVEAHADSAAIAELNTRPFGDRCRVVRAAIWGSAAELVLEEGGASHVNLRARSADDPPDLPIVPAMTLDQLLATELGPAGEVDYLIITIEEGCESVLAAGGEWPGRVRTVKVEIQPDRGFGFERAIELLEGLGYRGERERPRGRFVFGLR